MTTEDNSITKLIMKVEGHAETEEDHYKKAVLLRIKSSLKAIEVLIEHQIFLETPGLARIAFEHACRLYQYQCEPESITASHKKAFQMLGRSPGITYAVDHFDSNLAMVYKFLSAFTHPDLTSLILSLSQTESDSKLISLIIDVSVTTILIILLEIYPDSEFQEQELINQSTERTQEVILLIYGIIMEQKNNLTEAANLLDVYTLMAIPEFNEAIKGFINKISENPENDPMPDILNLFNNNPLLIK